MIRKLKETDIDRVAEIWLDTNVKTHNFIPAEYWRNNFNMVKEMLLQAEVYVYEKENKIWGFIGMNDTYIEGIFVADTAQSQGIGKKLLDFIKGRKEKLCLSVYQKNRRAVNFYQREDFEIQCENTDDNIGEKEYDMIWGKREG